MQMSDRASSRPLRLFFALFAVNSFYREGRKEKAAKFAKKSSYFCLVTSYF